MLTFLKGLGVSIYSQTVEEDAECGGPAWEWLDSLSVWLPCERFEIFKVIVNIFQKQERDFFCVGWDVPPDKGYHLLHQI